MPTFAPPGDDQVSPVATYFGDTPPDADPLMLRLMRFYKSTGRGRNVYLMADGSITETQPPNWNPGTLDDKGIADPVFAYSYTYAGGSNPPDGVTTFTLPTSQQVKRIYWGGCVNSITTAEATALQAAGYTTGP